MIDLLKQYLSGQPSSQHLNATREYLQWVVLQTLDDAGYRSRLCFTGGTCLRVVFGISRFSEDLDFSWMDSADFNVESLRGELLRRLTLAGLKVDASPARSGGAVASFFLRFGDLLHPLGLSSMKSEKLAIKFEVDTHPPRGGQIEEFLFQEPRLFLVNHFSLPSLFATKVHALLFRGFDKGRDYYDLFFFLRKKTEPDLALFRAAVKQTHPEMDFPNRLSVISAIRSKLEAMDEKAILKDVGPFLLDPSEARFLRKDVLLKSLSQAYP